MRNEKAKKEEEIKMKDEEIEDLKNVVDKIKSKEIEIKKLRDEIREKTEYLKEEEFRHNKIKNDYEGIIKEGKEVIMALKNNEIVNVDEIHELKRKEGECMEEIRRLNNIIVAIENERIVDEEEVENMKKKEKENKEEIDNLKKEMEMGYGELERAMSINESLSKINAKLEEKIDVMKDIVQENCGMNNNTKTMITEREESESPDRERGRSRVKLNRNKSRGRDMSQHRTLNRNKFRNELERKRVEAFRKEQNCWKYLEGKCEYGQRCVYYHPKN